MDMSKWSRQLHLFLFVLYIGVLFYFALFSEEFGRFAGARDYNLIPFSTIRRYIRYKDYFTEINYFVNLYGNVVAFMPFGYFLYYYLKNRNYFLGLILPVVFSLFIEISQFIFRVGSFDVDDILLNATGGFVVYVILEKKRFGKKYSYETGKHT